MFEAFEPLWGVGSGAGATYLLTSIATFNPCQQPPKMEGNCGIIFLDLH